MKSKILPTKSAAIIILLWLNATVSFAVLQGESFVQEKMIYRLERIKELGKSTGQSLSYSRTIIKGEAPAFIAETNNMEEWLYHSLESSDYTYRKVAEKEYVVTLKDDKDDTDEVENTKQTLTVKGRVVDNNREPLIGVNVVEKGTTNGTVTNIDGHFSLNVSPNSTLVFSYVGYTEKEFVWNGNSEVVIVLSEDAELLDEVVVTALGIKRSKKSLGYSSQEVAGDNLTDSGSDANMLNLLNGKVAGLQVTSGNSGPGSSTRVVIRGEASFSNDNQPLYVVDGVPVNNKVASFRMGTSHEVDYGNGAGEINPNDIASITVLKGANAAALYGSRAANGVILITTKSGGGSRGFSVNIGSTTTLESISTLPEYQNMYSQGLDGVFEYWNGANGKGTQDHQDMSWGRPLDGSLVPQFDSPSITTDGRVVRGGDVKARNGAEIQGTPLIPQPNNVRDFFDTGVTQVTDIAISGSNEKGSTRFSYSNMNGLGTIPNVNLKRNTLSLNSKYQITSFFRIDGGLTYMNSNSNNRPSISYGPENVMYTFAWFARQVNINSLKNYWQEGMEGVQQYHFNSGWNDNPYFTLYENTNAFDKNRTSGNVKLTFDIARELVFVLRSGVDWFHDSRKSKRAYSSQSFRRGAYKKENIFFMESNIDYFLQWNKNISSDFLLDLTFGGNRMDQKNSYDYAFANGLSVPGVYNLGNSISAVQVSENYSNKRINSLYGMGTLSYKDLFFLNFSARNDWSSALTNPDGTGHNSYFYPSISASLVLTEMMNLPKSIPYWSLRGGYAQVGSDTEPYRLQTAYGYSTQYDSNYGLILPNIYPAVDLKPERMESFEIGTDIRLFSNRVGLDLTYYNTLNKDQIVRVPISAATGYTERYINAGEIRNWGIEAMLSLQPIRAKNFTWDSNFNFSLNRGYVEKLDEKYDPYIYSWTAVYSDNSARVYAMAQEGERMGNLYGTGFKRTEAGELIVDATGLPVADNTIVKLGNYNPDFTLGWHNKLNYKDFSLSFLFDWRQGGIFVSRTYGMIMESGVGKDTENRNPEDMVVNGVVWNGALQTYEPNTKQVSPRDYYRNLYRRYHETQLTFDASFLKLRELSITYSLPSKLLISTPFRAANVSLVGRDLLMLTKGPKGIDPEAIAYEGSILTPGVEEMSYPFTRKYGIKLNFTF